MSLATDLAESVIKKLIYEVVVKAVIAKAVAALPFLGWPVFGPVFGFLVSKLAGAIYEELAKHASFLIIDFQTEAERRAYDEAARNLKAAIEAGTEDDVAKQKEEFKKRLADLVRLDRH